MKILILWRSFICSLTFFQILPLHFHNIVNDIHNVLSSLEKNQEKMTEKWESLFYFKEEQTLQLWRINQGRTGGIQGRGPVHTLYLDQNEARKKFFLETRPPLSQSQGLDDCPPLSEGLDTPLKETLSRDVYLSRDVLITRNGMKLEISKL